MAESKKSERYIPIKNYIIALVIVVGVILLTWYVFAWRKVYKEERVSVSYLEKNSVVTNIINDLDEVKQAFLEVPDSYFVYVSYTGSEDIYNMEKDLAKVIKKYNLSDDIYYINVTSIKEEKDYIDRLNKSLGLRDVLITQIPTIVYFKDGVVNKGNIITRNDDNMMNASDFQKLLDVNGIKK